MLRRIGILMIAMVMSDQGTDTANFDVSGMIICASTSIARRIGQLPTCPSYC